jgi:hypothetical protein
MADRTVTVHLRADVKPWLQGLAQAQGALKNFRDGLGDSWEPWDRETTKRRQQAPKDAEQVAGAFSRAFRTRLETAFKNLPQAKIDADSSNAQLRINNVRSALEGLASERIGVDIDSGTAMAELRAIQDELEDIRTSADDLDVRIDAGAAFAELQALHREIDQLDGRRARLDVDTSTAVASVGLLAKAAGATGTAFEKALGVIGQTTLGQVAIAAGAIAGLPLAAQVAAAGIVVALGGGLAAVGLTSAAQADRVKVEWSMLASDLRHELGDVASPLEDSAIHASGVARQAFQALKPTLREVFADLGPDVDHFVDGLGEAVERIGPSLEPLGAAFGDLLRSLGDQADLWGDNLSDAVTTFAETTSRHADDIATLFTAVTTAIRMTADATSWLADRWDGFLTVNEELHGSLLGINKDYDGSNAAIGRMMESMRGAIETAYGLNTATGESTTVVRSLSAALEDFFDPAAKALDAEIRLKSAIEQATQAAKDQSMSEVERLRSVQDLTKAIADAATAEAARTGKTTEAGKAFLDQLPALLEWAGKNDAAKAAISGLGDSLGITTLKTRDGTVAIDALGKAIKILPNGKKVEIDANTAKGKAEIQALMLHIARQKGTIDVHVRTIYDSKEGRDALARKQNLPAARGAIIQYAAGGITGYAAGGMRPHIVSKPTTILYGEGRSGRGAREAFIPLDEYRPEALRLLGRVAEEFGLTLYGREGNRQVQQVAVTVSDAATQLGAGLGAADISLTSAFGDTGTLTGAITEVGAVGEAMSDVWTTGSERLGDSMMNVATVTSDNLQIVAEGVDGLSMSVKDLLMALATGKAGGSSGSKSGKGSGYGHLLERMDTVRKPMSPKDKAKLALGAAESMLGAMGLGGLPKSPLGGMIEGDYGLSGTPDWTPGAYSAISYGAPVNTSRVSAPQQVPASAYGGGSSSGSSSAGGGSSTISKGGSLVTVENMAVREDADIDRVAASLYSRLGSKGP